MKGKHNSDWHSLGFNISLFEFLLFTYNIKLFKAF